MSNSKYLIEESINEAKQEGHIIIRGAMFDWTMNPIACNAIGAVILKLNMEEQFRNSFPKNWINVINNYLSENSFWLWRFVSGFDYGNQIIFTRIVNDKEVKEKDEVSKYGNALALRVTKNV